MHQVTERYRLLEIGSGSDFSSPLAMWQKTSTSVRSTLQCACDAAQTSRVYLTSTAYWMDITVRLWARLMLTHLGGSTE